MPCAARPRCWRATAARWLAALMACVAFGPLVSGALQQAAAARATVPCVAHAAHAQGCVAGHEHHGPAGGATHCLLCLVAQHAAPHAAPERVPLMVRAPSAAVAALPPALAPADAERRWLSGRTHAPPAAGIA